MIENIVIMNCQYKNVYYIWMQLDKLHWLSNKYKSIKRVFFIIFV